MCGYSFSIVVIVLASIYTDRHFLQEYSTEHIHARTATRTDHGSFFCEVAVKNKLKDQKLD